LKKLTDFSVEELEHKISRYDRYINKLNQRRWRLRKALEEKRPTECKHKDIIKTGYYLHDKEIIKCKDCGIIL
jgi:demethoxyubiquinone hydroxylase (CLK1/Coq7/Cat5 family)